MSHKVFHSPVSNLTRPEQVRCGSRVVQAALLGYHHAPAIHYTQDLTARWHGISQRRIAALGQYPDYADCSAYATWCLWNGLALIYHRPDVVNGETWRAGYGGTMLNHGKRQTTGNCLPGDCVIYGHGFPGEHVALIVGRRGSTPMVVSHGSEAGPLFLPYNYRSDIMSIRRYI